MTDEKIRPRRMDELSEHEKALVDNMDQLAKPMLLASTIVFDLSDGRVASGVVVSYADHRWIATAAHVVEEALDDSECRVCWAPPEPGAEYRDRRLTDLILAWKPISGGDMAAVLLRDQVQLDGVEFVAASRCSRATQPWSINDLVWTVGSPLARRTEDRFTHDLPNAQSQVFARTHVRSECGSDPAHADDDMGKHPRPAEHDFHVDWSDAMQPGGAYRRLFPAGGMSGSPVWSGDQPDVAVWDPQSVQLVAINWYENRDTKCLRAVPFGCWFAAADECLQVVQDEIARRAYLRWTGSGRTHGHDLEDWFAARRALNEGRK